MSSVTRGGRVGEGRGWAETQAEAPRTLPPAGLGVFAYGAASRLHPENLYGCNQPCARDDQTGLLSLVRVGRLDRVGAKVGRLDRVGARVLFQLMPRQPRPLDPPSHVRAVRGSG